MSASRNDERYSYVDFPTCTVADAAPGPSRLSTSRHETAVFPPAAKEDATSSANAATRRFSMSIPSTSISTNVSDLLLASLLPPNLPRLPAPKNEGRVRQLTTQREGLGVNLLSNNFRRFVTRVGPLFWLLDRCEEVLYWRKPSWTWAWMLLWTFTCFQPRVLLLLPSLALIVVLLHLQEQRSPRPSLLGNATNPAAATSRISLGSSKTDPVKTGSFSTTVAEEGESQPVVPPKEAESGVDYYMNLQAIQNLMGLIADAYDIITSRLVNLSSPSQATNLHTLPISFTHLLLILIPPTLFLPLTPRALIPYLLLPVGTVPPLLFHPFVLGQLDALPRRKGILQARSLLERGLLNDALPDDIGRSAISHVEVWENERFDPTTKTWSGRNLTSGDRPNWIKVRSAPVSPSLVKSTSRPRRDSVLADNESLWASISDYSTDGKMVLALRVGWEWIKTEDWRIDVYGFWSDVGVDEDGWVYMDDAWLGPSVRVDEGKAGEGGRKVTRRRRWWRRVCQPGLA